MNSVVQLVQTTAYELTPESARMPSMLWSVFSSLNKVHCLWRYYRRIELYRQPTSLAQMIVGHGAAHLLGDVYILRVAAQCVLVTARIMDCVKQQLRLYNAGKRLIAAFWGYYPKPIVVSCKQAGFCLISPTTIYQTKRLMWSIWERVSRIALCALKLGQELFVLSMRILDVWDTLSWSPAVGQEAMEESVVNVSKILEMMVDKREELLKALEQNKPIIERLLQNSSLNYELLHSRVSQILYGAEKVYLPLKNVSSVAGSVLLEAFEGGRVVIGL